MSTPSSSAGPSTTPRRSTPAPPKSQASVSSSTTASTAGGGGGGPPSSTASAPSAGAKRANPPARKSAGAGSASSGTAPSAAAAAANALLPNVGAVPPLAYPPPILDNLAGALAPLMDEASSDAAVAQSCLQIAQHVGDPGTLADHDLRTSGSGGGSGFGVGSGAVLSSSLIHEASWADFTTRCLEALTRCATAHKDRRCRVASISTLGIVARAVYGKVRPSPLLYHTRQPIPKQLEEEASMDVPSTLVAVALNDADDGVSSSALVSLGMLVLSSSFTTSTPGEDELLREGLGMTRNLMTPYAPSLRAVAEEDPSVANLELALRVLDRAVLPRLVQLVDRVAGYGSPHALVVPTLPVLTAALVHAVKATAGSLFRLDRGVYAKRWPELNAVGLVDVVVTQLLLPLLEVRSARAPAVALSLVRLAHACPHQGWQGAACRGAAACLVPPPDADLETKLAQLAYLVIAVRPLPLLEKLPHLQSATALLAQVPSTIGIPAGIVSPGIKFEHGGFAQIRQPARVGLWAEVALSLVLDGPAPLPPDPPTDAGAAPAFSSPSRAHALQVFLATGAMGKVLAEREQGDAAATLYDEILLSFCTVAVQVSKRFRSTADGAPWYPEDSSPALLDWQQASAAILAVFAPCVHLRTADDLSLLAAGQAAYVCLLQEYLFPVGYCNADSCVSVKLAGNACPPHLLWDQLATSAAVLSRLEAEPNEDLDGPASRIVDELVAREIKQGIATHTMRVYVLTLAADHWIQGRIASIRKHLDSTNSNGDAHHTPQLRASGGREIALALSPKRVLAKLLETQPLNPLVEDPKKKQRDPARRLALETVKASVACIEGIALMACDWRRRFGASPETKQLVSVAVGLLQGKLDETPIDESARAIMAPACEAAVSRIQAFYESESAAVDPMELAFPVSDLVSQPFKPKIKPLVTSANPPAAPKEKVIRNHLMQLCRQVVIARSEQAVYSMPVADSLLSNARVTSFLRLSVPPLPESKDARLLGIVGRPLMAWGSSVNMSSASSDAFALITAYTYRRHLRSDGAEDFRVNVLMRAFNTTLISFPDGLRLELGVVRTTHNLPSESDPTDTEFSQLLGVPSSSTCETPLVSCLVTYKSEIKSGDFVTWEVSLHPSVLVTNAAVVPSLVFRNVVVEPSEAGATWITGERMSSVAGDASTHAGSAESKSGEDDFHVTRSDKGKTGSGEETLTEAVTLPGDPMFLTPLIGLLPCPMVFLRDRWGDSSTFRLFWFNLPVAVPPLSLMRAMREREVSQIDETIAKLSALKWQGEAIPGGVATKLWAFCSLRGVRVFGVLTVMDNGKSTSTPTLHLRGDDMSLLQALVGSRAARESFVAVLCPGMTIARP